MLIYDGRIRKKQLKQTKSPSVSHPLAGRIPNVAASATRTIACPGTKRQRPTNYFYEFRMGCPPKKKQNKTVRQTSDVHMLATTLASKHNEFNMLCHFNFGTLSAVTMTQYDLGGSPQPKQHGTGAGIHEDLLWFLLPFRPQIPILIALPEANMAPQT